VERQNTRINVYKQALEITWLAIIFLVPLFFNPLSYQVFYLNKALLLQFLVMVMLGFWVADWLLNRGSHNRLKRQAIFTSPLDLSILVFGLLTILATAASITPSISFWGSYFRKEGLLTLICWIIFFLIVSQQLRTKAQLFRAIYVLLASSGIVSYLGILQHFFPDVTFKLFQSTYTSRIYSTTGNALSLSCFLAMVIPFNLALIVYSWNKITFTCHPERQRRVSKPSARLTTSQVLRSLRSRFFLFPFVMLRGRVRMTGRNMDQSSHNRGKWANTIRLIGLVVLLALQFWCLWLAQYSITILLYILSPVIFIIILGIVRRRRLILSLGAVSLLILGIIAGLLLVPLLFSSTSVESTTPAELEPVPVSEAVGLNTLGLRVQYWRSTVDILTKSPEVPFSNDKLHFLRRVIGYGPETFIVTVQLFLPEKMEQHSNLLFIPLTRPHNHYLYLATTIGLLGLLSFLSILTVFFYLCFRYLRRSTADIDKLLLIAVVAAMFQYMADMFLNPTTISPELVFWLTLGIVPVIGRLTSNGEPEKTTSLDSTEPDNSQKSHVDKTRKYVSAVAVLALIVVGVGITIQPLLADMYIHKGLKQGNNIEKAIPAFKNAIKMAPNEAAYWNSLGYYAYWVARNVKEETLKTESLTLATNAYEKARELEPYIAFRYYALADIYTYRANRGDVDKWPMALSMYDKAAQLIPRNPLILNMWSFALIIEGDFSQAQTKLAYSASIDPDWAETSFLSGLLLAREGKHDGAVLKITAPIQKNPANLNPFIDACGHLITYDMVSPLKDTLEIQADKEPDNWIVHALLGITGLFGGNVDKSLDEFNTAMLLVPGNDARDLLRAIYRLSTMSPKFKTALPSVANGWKEKLAQSTERDTLLPLLNKLVNP
jgi:tetratricopeptide (TPR) repeat protein